MTIFLSILAALALAEILYIASSVESDSAATPQLKLGAMLMVIPLALFPVLYLAQALRG